MVNSFGAGQLSFNGWVPAFARDWTALGGDPDRTLRGNLFLSSPISVLAGRERAVHTLAFRMRPAAAPHADESAPRADEQLLFSRTQGALLFIGIEGSGTPPTAELIANIPPEEFDALWASVQAPHSVQVSAALKGTSYNEKLKLTDQGVTKQVLDLSLRVRSADAVPQDWAATRIAKDIEDALADLHLDVHIGSNQVRKVVHEFAESVAKRAPASAHGKYLEAIRELVSKLRPAFRAPLNLQTGSQEDAHYLAPAAFTAAVSKHRPQDAQKLLAGYDTLWEHFNVANVIATGEAKTGATPAGFRPVVEELEQAAARLLEQSEMSSPTLEWALVGALIYAECIAFAQIAYSGQTVLGVPVSGELKGVSQPKLAFKSLAWSALNAAFEVVKVAATFAVAVVLAQDNLQTAWVVTTGVTAARWIRLAILRKADANAPAARVLLLKMANTHELLKWRQFNARALRQELYRVSAEGAVFSPWVFNILDARIRREG